jgi:ferredoxin
MKIVIDKQKCMGSGECAKACPENTISLVDNKAVIDNSKCDADGICIPACVNNAISLEED